MAENDEGEVASVSGADAKAAELETEAQKLVPAVCVDCKISIGGVDFVLVPVAEAALPAGRAARLRHGEASIPARLRDARRAARLSQRVLAEKLGRSQALVSQAESGRRQVGERYLGAVLAVCGLPETWGAAATEEVDPNDESWQLDSRQIAGMDPTTLELVRRGSARDKELGEQYAWWNNRPYF